MSVLITSCTSKRYYNRTPIVGVEPPSECTKEWFLDVEKDDTGRDIVIPKCVKKDVVQWGSSAKIAKELKQERGEISKWELDKLLLAGVTAVGAGVAAFFGWLGGLLSF